MRKGFLGAGTVLLAGAGMALAQYPYYPQPGYSYGYYPPQAAYFNMIPAQPAYPAAPAANGNNQYNPYNYYNYYTYSMPVQAVASAPRVVQVPAMLPVAPPQPVSAKKVMAAPVPLETIRAVTTAVTPASNAPELQTPPTGDIAADEAAAAKPVEESKPAAETKLIDLISPGDAKDFAQEPCVLSCPQKKCCPGPHMWFRAEYLMWWIKGYDVPPLVTTGPVMSDVAFLGNPGTQVLFGGNDISNDFFNGGRFSAGIFFDKCNTWGIEGSYFFLGEQGNDTTFNSAQTPVLARPFFNINLGQEFSQVVAFPGIATGSVGINDFSRLQGADTNLIRAICCGCKCCSSYQLNALAGFRYLDLDEGLAIHEDIDFANTPLADGFAGRNVQVTDSFGTRNQFYGGQIGLSGWGVWRHFVIDLRALVAFGSTNQTLDILGAQSLAGGGLPPVLRQGGLLALPSNSGTFTHDQFSVIPEVTVNLGYQFHRNLRAFVGYNFLYWTDVLRPGDQIDRNLNANLIPGFGTFPAAPVQPLATFNTSDFWAQGLNFGAQLQW